MIRTIWCAYEGVKNVSFSENFALVRKLDDPLFKITISGNGIRVKNVCKNFFFTKNGNIA